MSNETTNEIYTADISAVLSLITGRMVPVKDGNGYVELISLCEFLSGEALSDIALTIPGFVAPLVTLCKSGIPPDLAQEDGSEVHDGASAWCLRDKWVARYGQTVEVTR